MVKQFHHIILVLFVIFYVKRSVSILRSMPRTISSTVDANIPSTISSTVDANFLKVIESELLEALKKPESQNFRLQQNTIETKLPTIESTSKKMDSMKMNEFIELLKGIDVVLKTLQQENKTLRKEVKQNTEMNKKISNEIPKLVEEQVFLRTENIEKEIMKNMAKNFNKITKQYVKEAIQHIQQTWQEHEDSFNFLLSQHAHIGYLTSPMESKQKIQGKSMLDTVTYYTSKEKGAPENGVAIVEGDVKLTEMSRLWFIEHKSKFQECIKRYFSSEISPRSIRSIKINNIRGGISGMYNVKNNLMASSLKVPTEDLSGRNDVTFLLEVRVDEKKVSIISHLLKTLSEIMNKTFFKEENKQLKVKSISLMGAPSISFNAINKKPPIIEDQRSVHHNTTLSMNDMTHVERSSINETNNTKNITTIKPDRIKRSNKTIATKNIQEGNSTSNNRFEVISTDFNKYNTDNSKKIESHDMNKSKNPRRHHKFNYDLNSNLGVQHWGETWEKCNGSKQSPIAIGDVRLAEFNDLISDGASREQFQSILPQETKKKTKEEIKTLISTGKYFTVQSDTLPKVSISYTPIVGLKLINNGNNIFVEYPKDTPGILSFSGKTFQLRQFSIHTPGEHVVNGERAAVELHLVHERVIKNTDNSQEFLILAVRYTLGAPSSFFDGFVNAIPESPNTSKNIPNTTKLSDTSKLDLTIAVMGSSPAELTSHEYYTYIGSLTFPPCLESVIWLLPKWNRTVSPEQVKILQSALANGQNARPTQNDRWSEIPIVRTGEVER